MPQIRKNDFIKHIKQSNLMTEFKQTDPGSDLHWQKIIGLAFRSQIFFQMLYIKIFWSNRSITFMIFDTSNDFFRIFDTNNDGFIDKREFRWMTTSTVISPEVIQTVFQVSK